MAVKTKNKAERAARRAREDKIYSLILSAFGVCILLELILISLYRVFYTSDAYGLEFYLGRLWWLCLIPAAGCVLLLVLKKDSRKLRSLRAVNTEELQVEARKVIDVLLDSLDNA